MSLSELEPAEVWRDTWARLARATRDRRHAFRHPVVATRCPRRGIAARTVVLREVEAGAACLTLYTDRRAGKLEGIALDPRVSWCFYDGRPRMQVRAESVASVHVGDDVARAAWERQGPAARRLYAVDPAPATRLGAGETPRFDTGEDAGFDHFAVVRCTVGEVDWLLLGRDGHRRIVFERGEDGFAGTPVVP